MTILQNFVLDPNDANGPENLVTIESQEWVDRFNALQKLWTNPDFQTLILDGYFKTYAQYGVSMLANASVVKSGERPDVIEQLVGISRLNDYFLVVRNLGGAALQDAEEDRTNVDA